MAIENYPTSRHFSVSLYRYGNRGENWFMGVLGRSHDERSGCGLHDKAPYAAAPLMTCRLDLTAGIFKARKVFVGRVWTSGRYLPSLPQFYCAEL